MKMQYSEYNPFFLILSCFSEKSASFLTLEQLQTVKSFLELGGIICESEEEVIGCLFLMKDLGLIDIKTVEKNNETYYEVTKVYGK